MSKYVGFKKGKLHESHVISEYYCGGCGYPLTDHDSFCPECGGALRKCDADTLEDENTKLREENARLRKKLSEFALWSDMIMLTNFLGVNNDEQNT